MKKGVTVICAFAILYAGWMFTLRAQQATEGLVEVRVRGITVDPQRASPIVLLEELQGARVMPIWVGVFEARAIAMQMEKVVPPRPMTHDLLKNILQGVNAQVQNVAITELKENTFYARIAVNLGPNNVSIDARPSDAIALALRVNAPIFVARAVFDSSPSVDLRAELPDPFPILKRFGLTLQNLTPELAQHFHLATPEGVLVSDVEVGSGAERDGVRRGDVIVGAKQVKIRDLQALDVEISQGGEIPLHILRQEKPLTLVLHLPDK